MTIPKLALRNLLGAGLRTWLNVIVLSFAFVTIIWTQGLYKGMGDRAEKSMKEVEFGGGQYWMEKYDPYDPLSLTDAHAPVPAELKSLIEQGGAVPVLIVQGTIYPEGRIRTILVKGIDSGQKVLTFPSHLLHDSDDEIPALIGGRMSDSTGLSKGDYVTLRWRDAEGTFDARDVKIVEVMKTSVQTVDANQIWIPLDTLREMTGMPGEGTLVVIGQKTIPPGEIAGWMFRDLDFLLQDLKSMVQSKTIGASIIYVVLLFLAMLAIFDTQVLSIFRRRKEMGTLMALGFTRGKVIRLFTLEGALHSLLAAAVAAVYGIPLLTLSAKKGWAMPEGVDSYGFALGDKLFPTYSAGLVIGTTVLVFIITAVVSFLPTRKIAKLKPTDALRGKMS
jgi:ABC-type lipoprotein release transport system permease subunit